MGRNETKFEEDWAYCLLGIFGVFMLLNYGERKNNAVDELQKEMNEVSEQLKSLPYPLIIPFFSNLDITLAHLLMGC